MKRIFIYIMMVSLATAVHAGVRPVPVHGSNAGSSAKAAPAETKGQAAEVASPSQVNALERAKRYPLEMNKPAIDFFEGAVLGNGGMGVVVTTRPDAIHFHFGHNNIWDIRVAENNQEKTGTFAEIFARVKALPEGLKRLENDPWFKGYIAVMRENYDKPYPRPFPCGTVMGDSTAGKWNCSVIGRIFPRGCVKYSCWWTDKDTHYRRLRT